MRAWKTLIPTLAMIVLGGCASAPVTPSPLPTPTATLTAAPTPTATAEPIATATPSLPPSPSATPTATAQEGISVVMAGVLGTTGVELFFQPRTINAPAGSVTFLLKNRTEAPHDMIIGPQKPVCGQGGCEFGPVIAASQLVPVGGEDEQFTVDELEAGTYSFWCGVENHAQLGMIGTLNVGP